MTIISETVLFPGLRRRSERCRFPSELDESRFKTDSRCESAILRASLLIRLASSAAATAKTLADNINSRKS